VGQSDKLPLQSLEFDCLRLFLGGSVVLGNELYESFFRDAVGLLLNANKKSLPIAVPKAAIEPVGFLDNQCLLNHDPRTIQAYRLLWEFFALPEKFRFADLRLGNVWSQAVGNENSIDVILLFGRSSSVLARELRNDTIRLGCTPVINLFDQRSEPFRHSENQSEYRIIPTSRKPQSMEVISVNEVTASSPGGESQRIFRPFFGASHQSTEPENELFWHSTRRRRLSEESEGDRGTEVYLTLVDLLSKPLNMSDWTVHVSTTCCNRDLVSKLFSSGKPRVSMSEAGGAIHAEFLTAPTPTMRPLTHGSYYWRLVSHLSLNHLSLTDSPKGAEALREILTLYNPSESEETKRAIQSLDSVSYKRSVARIKSGHSAGFCRGLDIEVVVDEERLVGMGAYMFATILDHFFSTFATINSFTRLTVRTLADQDPLMVGKPRAGDREWL
jgi:type VI secretion system protein ImpG